MPAALMFPSGNKFYDWIYSTDEEPHMGGRKVAHARGKVLGGSSSINGMIYQRGNQWTMKAGQNQKVWKLGILRTVYRILKIRKHTVQRLMINLEAMMDQLS